MRIGIDLRVANGPSGQQRYLWRLGRWLGEAGHDVHLLVTRKTPHAGDADAAPEVTVHDLASASATGLRKVVRDLRLDVLLLNPERSDPYAGIRANLLRPGYGTDQYSQKLRSFRNPVERGLRTLLRGLPPIRGKRRRERGFYETPDGKPQVIAVSDYMRQEILRSWEVSEDQVHVVPNGVDTEAFSPDVARTLRVDARLEFGIPESALCVLIVAHNYRLKGVRGGMEHISGLRKKGIDAHLLVAGSGTGSLQRRRAHAWRRDLGLESAVHFPGTVHPVTRAYAAADVFLHPSWHDAFGFVVLEAMACGLPPITTPWTGASMLVESGVSGHVVDPADSGTIVRRLLELASPETHRRMGKEARRVAERHTELVNFQALERMCRLARDGTDGPVR